MRSFPILNNFRGVSQPGQICFGASVGGTGIGFIYTTTMEYSFRQPQTYLCQYDRCGVFLNKMLIRESMQICSVPPQPGQILSAELNENGIVNITWHNFNDRRGVRTLITQNHLLQHYLVFGMAVNCDGSIILLHVNSIRCFGGSVTNNQEYKDMGDG